VPGAPATSKLRNPLPEGVDSADYYISQSPLGHCLALPGPPPRNFFEDTTNPRDPPQAADHSVEFLVPYRIPSLTICRAIRASGHRPE
jgi:hypothetical protein